MRKVNRENGPIDIPLSCSFFLEPALVRFAPCVANMTQETLDFIHQWNIALLSVVNDPRNRNLLGYLGKRISIGINRYSDFGERCVNSGGDMTSWSLHYAIRFAESLDFLVKKQRTQSDIKFVDMGCGLSPMAAVAKNEYKISDAYCIDTEPLITDVYGQTIQTMGVSEPVFLDWAAVTDMAPKNQINTIIGMGVFPYMSTEEQLAHFKFIYEHISNFLIEIKYNPNPNRKIKNSFTLQSLVDIGLDVENVDSLETAIMRNSVRYLHRFRRLLPDARRFVAGDRSLFLSR